MVTYVHNNAPVAPASTTPGKSKNGYTEPLKLDDLRKRRIITEGELEAQKAKLLSESSLSSATGDWAARMVWGHIWEE